MKRHWWFSFCDPNRPTGTRFLGAVLVDDAPDFETAYFAITAIGINPGGEVAGVDWVDGDAPEHATKAFNAAPKLTLLSRAQLQEHGLEPTTEAEYEAAQEK